MPRVLITGVSGFLGSNLALHFQREGWLVWGTHHAHAAAFKDIQERVLDICVPDEIARVLDEAKPDAVIHAAAMAAPDDCAADLPATRQINVQGPRLMAEACAARGIKLVFTSSDLVFAGDKPFQVETDAPSPLGVYGKSKADAEIEVLGASGCRPLAARMALMYGWGRGVAKGRNLAEKWLRTLLTGGRAQSFTDQFRTALYVEDACIALRLAIEKDLRGILHVAGPERVSRYDLAVNLARAFSLPPEAIIPGSALDVVFHDPRPLDLTLSVERLKTETGFTPRGMQAGVEEMHQDLLRQA
jgi:dTDP-4-dehydrorhamnose reductase